MRSGGKILVDQFVVHGIEAVFTVPGESFLPVLDALRDAASIRTVTCRHEGGAAMMAEAAARLADRPAVALVTRAPGAANAMAGVVCAKASAAPLLLVVGLPPLAHAGRPGTFQDLDIAAVFGPLAKWAAVCRDVTRIPEFVQRACHVALTGRPGPVVLGLPEDVLAAVADVVDGMPGASVTASVTASVAAAPDRGALARLARLLAEAQRPLLIVGGPGWSSAARRDLEAFAAAFDLPVASAFRRQDAFDNRHPSYAGHCGIGTAPKLAAAMRAADLVLLAGAEPDEITTGGWRFLTVPTPGQRIVAMPREAGAASGLLHAELTLSAAPAPLAAALAALEPPWLAGGGARHAAGNAAGNAARGETPDTAPDSTPDTAKSMAESTSDSVTSGISGPAPWATWRRDLAAAYRASLEPPPPPALLPRIFAELSARLPDTAIMCGGAGNYAAFLHRYFAFKDAHTSLSPPSGSMGYGLPAAIAASLANPGTLVVAVAGDGCFLMSAQELATAAQYGASLIVVVVNNGMYGTIRLHQERRFPGRAFATSLANPDFVAMAESFGARARRVTDVDDFTAALAAFLDADGLRLIEVAADPDEIGPETRLSRLGEAD